MEQRQHSNASPQWYRNTAIVFFVIGLALTGAWLKKHDWVYGAFAGITFLNAIMTTLKFITVRGTAQ
ncbi:MAG TPA: hypothetical protein VE783_02155 [Candidatus Limnocylindrales bacterium]|nr:hypothetical protein [Candidatus Limnocylindrales bacterium]